MKGQWSYAGMVKRLGREGVALLYLGKHSLIPELYTALGRPLFLKLIGIFGGMSLTIPTEEEMVQAITDIDIYSSLVERSTPTAVADLSEKYGYSVDELRAIVSRVHTELETIDTVRTSLLHERRDVLKREEADVLREIRRVLDGE